MIRTEIAGIPISRLIAGQTTPFFVYDAEQIRRRIADLKRFETIRYAQKACSNLSILKLIREEGAVVDCVSANEIRRAFAAGFPEQAAASKSNQAGAIVPSVVYTADIFDRESLDLVVEKNVPVNCGSMDMIAQYGERIKGQNKEITLRINPGFGHGHSRKTNTGGDQSKHGIWFEHIGQCKQLAAKYGLRITGLHNHIGSGTDFEHLSQVCGVMKKIALEFGPEIEMISTGGGFPIPYRPGETYIDLERYHEIWDKTCQDLSEAFGHKVRLEIEPGRYIIAESGYLITEIRAVKKQADNLFYIVDAGFNNLARPIMYGAYHPISICPRNANGDTTLCDVIIGGPLCESGDIFTQQEGGFVEKRTLPLAQVGDFLIVEIAGAYGFVMGSNYNSKPLAAELLIDAGQIKTIRRRQTFEQIIQNELSE